MVKAQYCILRTKAVILNRQMGKFAIKSNLELYRNKCKEVLL